MQAAQITRTTRRSLARHDLCGVCGCVVRVRQTTAGGGAPGAAVSREQRLIQHPDAVCALGVVPTLLEEWYSTCRAAFLALLQVPNTGMVRRAYHVCADSCPASA